MTIPTYINFFGTGIRYWYCRFSAERIAEFDACRSKQNIEWIEFFMDLDALAEFEYSSWDDFDIIKKGSGWFPKDNNWIEIKSGRKKRKISAEQFRGEGYMFDLFSKRQILFDIESPKEYVNILLYQIEVGLIAKFRTENEIRDVSNLIFMMSPEYLTNMTGNEWVESVQFNSFDLEKIQDDTVVRESHVTTSAKSELL